MWYFKLEPVTKPRQTQRDKWMVRPEVARYRAFADELRLLAQSQKLIREAITGGVHILFLVPMPASWSARKKLRHHHAPHQSEKADYDNLAKAFTDALFTRGTGGDGFLYDVRITKLWAYPRETGMVVRRLEAEESLSIDSMLSRVSGSETISASYEADTSDGNQENEPSRPMETMSTSKPKRGNET